MDLVNTDPKLNFSIHLPFFFKKALEAENWELKNRIVNERNAFGRLTVAIKETLSEVEAHIGTDFPAQASELKARYNAINTRDEDTKEVNRKLNEVNTDFMAFMDKFKPGYLANYNKALNSNDIKVALDFATLAKNEVMEKQTKIGNLEDGRKPSEKKKGFFGSLFS